MIKREYEFKRKMSIKQTTKIQNAGFIKSMKPCHPEKCRTYKNLKIQELEK